MPPGLVNYSIPQPLSHFSPAKIDHGVHEWYNMIEIGFLRLAG